jgi:hypothetical protein
MKPTERQLAPTCDEKGWKPYPLKALNLVSETNVVSMEAVIIL